MANFTVEDLYAFKGAGEARLSPDESKMVYVVQYADKEEDTFKTNLFLKDLTTMEETQLTFSGKDKGPVFSPDGTRIAFISNRSGKNQIYILSLSGGEPWCIKTNESVMGPLLWTPEGNELIYSAAVFSHKADDWLPYPGAPRQDGNRLKEIADNLHKSKDELEKDKDKKKNEVKVITRFSYRSDGQGYYGNVRNHIFSTLVPDQWEGDWKEQGKQLTDGDFDHSGPSLSPCGNYLVVSSRRTATADHDKSVDLWIVERKTGKIHQLYEAPGPVQGPNWSPCGQFIAFGGHDFKAGESTSTHLWLLQIDEFMEKLKNHEDTKPYTVVHAYNLLKSVDRPIGGAGSDVGIRGGDTKGWQQNRLLFLIGDKGAGQLYEVELNGKEWTPKPVIASESQTISTITVSKSLIVFSMTDPLTPPELYYWKDQKVKQLTFINKKLAEKGASLQWEKFTYKSDREGEIDGWLLYPSGFDKNKKYPLVLLIHGGPHASYGPAFMFLAQLFVSRGYVVLYTNPRGSETYGQHFAEVIDRNWGDLDYKDIMVGVDKVVDRGFIDKDNMFVHGWSYGGYMSCWISTQTSRFKAICAGASVTNMVSGYGTSDITMADEYEYGGTPWKDGEHLIHHSPIGHVEKVETPVMLMHGENDMRVAPSQTEEFYIALKRLNKEAIMVRYPGEFHGLGRPLHQADRLERLLAWFNYYRKNK
ncbi:MAG: S9 family peptidase [Bacillus sp. (in: Bacteria)]|nr:S9 family peptidase [Bacillus sp. (in: firmicutes)]